MARKSDTASAEVEQTDAYNMHGQTGTTSDDPNALPSMLEAEIDLDSAPPPDPLPKGTYPAQVNTATVKMSQKGNRYIEVQFFIAPDAYPADFNEGNPQGMNLAYRRIDASINPLTGKLTPRAAYQIGQFMKRLGMSGGKSVDVLEWAGHDARVRIDHRPGQNDKNELFPEIVEVLPA